MLDAAHVNDFLKLVMQQRIARTVTPTSLTGFTETRSGIELHTTERTTIEPEQILSDAGIEQCTNRNGSEKTPRC